MVSISGNAPAGRWLSMSAPPVPIFSDEVDGALVAARATSLLAAHQDKLARRTDALFGRLLIAEWILAIALAAWVSPRTWSGATSQPHLHLELAVFLGGLVVALPVALARLRPGAVVTRQSIACAQMLLGVLLIHVTGGRLETHFYLFGSLAVLAFYRDWRVLVTASLIVLADHLVRGAIWPESVYGTASSSVLRGLEHGAWIVFEDVFLMMACMQGQREMAEIATRHSQLEVQNKRELEVAAANEKSRVQGEFLANMSHEIRTPLAAVTGYADLLLDPSLGSDERIEYVQTIRRNGDHLLRLINDILDISKMEAGMMTVESIPCSPAQVVVDVASLMRVSAQEKELGFEVRFVGPIPDSIATDPTRLRQILLNLVGNAIKFTPCGEITMRVCCEGIGTGRTRLVVEVQDTGIGMSPSQAIALFRPFTQADASATRLFGGTGLGLSISKNLALLLGGDVTVQSAPGVGTSFFLVLPFALAPGVAMRNDLTDSGFAPSSRAEQPGVAVIVAGTSVLLAEDGRDNQRLIATFLRRAGATVTIVDDGQKAVDEALAAERAFRPYNIVLMDMQMPKLDGYGATASLRERGYTRPIVALTAHAMAGDRDRCIGAGCDDYVSKPVVRGALEAILVRYAAPVPDPRLVSELADDADLGAIVAEFVEEMPERVRALLEAVNAWDVAHLQDLAHNLKGAGGSYGFPLITDAAGALERAVLMSEPAVVRREASRLVALCLRTCVK